MKQLPINVDKMLVEFKNMGEKALAMSHYELERACDKRFTAEEWRSFLSKPEIQEYINKEMTIIRDSTVNKLVQSSATTKSVANAQMLNTLSKMSEDSGQKEGPIFIYCHVPLNDEQKHADNIVELNADASKP